MYQQITKDNGKAVSSTTGQAPPTSTASSGKDVSSCLQSAPVAPASKKTVPVGSTLTKETTTPPSAPLEVCASRSQNHHLGQQHQQQQLLQSQLTGFAGGVAQINLSPRSSPQNTTSPFNDSTTNQPQISNSQQLATPQLQSFPQQTHTIHHPNPNHMHTIHHQAPNPPQQNSIPIPSSTPETTSHQQHHYTVHHTAPFHRGNVAPNVVVGRDTNLSVGDSPSVSKARLNHQPTASTQHPADQQIRVLTPSEIMRTLPSLGQEGYDLPVTPTVRTLASIARAIRSFLIRLQLVNF